jgi:hypothetical protein
VTVASHGALIDEHRLPPAGGPGGRVLREQPCGSKASPATHSDRERLGEHVGAQVAKGRGAQLSCP